MSISTYDIGDVAELKGIFTDTDTGEPTEPDTVTCTVRKPNGALATPTVTAVGDGVYTAQVPLDRDGTWRYAFDGTGGHQASGERAFNVRARTIPR